MPSSIRPAGASFGGGGRDNGFEPDSGRPFWIHDSSSSISWTSESRFCLRDSLDLGGLILLGFLRFVSQGFMERCQAVAAAVYSVEDDDDKRRPSVLGFLVKTPPREVFSYSTALAFTLSPLVGEPRN